VCNWPQVAPFAYSHRPCAGPKSTRTSSGAIAVHDARSSDGSEWSSVHIVALHSVQTPSAPQWTTRERGSVNRQRASIRELRERNGCERNREPRPSTGLDGPASTVH
jgi:hypothetical protein